MGHMEKGGSMENQPEGTGGAGWRLNRTERREVDDTLIKARDTEVARTEAGMQAMAVLKEASMVRETDRTKIREAINLLNPKSSEREE